MNVRLAAVDDSGREIEDDEHPDLSPLDNVTLDVVPRAGDDVMFYNMPDRGYWTVVRVVWMFAPTRGRSGPDGYGYPVVEIRRKREQGGDGG